MVELFHKLPTNEKNLVAPEMLENVEGALPERNSFQGNMQTESKELHQGMRFVLSDRGGRRGVIWQFWVTDDSTEVHLTNELVGGSIKAVFSAGGEWQINNQLELSGTINESRDDPKARYFYSWPTPKMLARGITDLFTIITPSFGLSQVNENVEEGVLSIPNCSEGFASRIDIISVAPRTSINRLFEWGQGSINPVASFVLSDEQTVWVVNQEVELPDLSQALRGVGLSINMKPKGSGDTTHRRTLIFMEIEKGERIIGDYVFGGAVNP